MITFQLLVIKRGIRNVHYYYIPIDKVEGWDKSIVWLNITEKEVKNKYEKMKNLTIQNIISKDIAVVILTLNILKLTFHQ